MNAIIPCRVNVSSLSN